MSTQLDHAYAVCRGITRSAARNFYYAFIVLPRAKRNALAAVYAFMRHSDDICDDPGLPLAEKHARLAQWLEELHQVLDGKATDDPVLMALADAQRRFTIPLELFDQLVQGTAMDLPESESSGPAPAIAYRTFDELRGYCHYVASVVGLVCIRIFGYRDPAAEPLAERCGLAFQLTNIIRDVKEDAAMGRVYLPEEDLARFDLSAEHLSDVFDAAALRPVLELEAERAREFYRSAEKLLPLIDEDCRPALWTLVEIYRRLLEKIAARGYDVFRERVRLTVPEKLHILSKGILRRLAA